MEGADEEGEETEIKAIGSRSTGSTRVSFASFTDILLMVTSKSTSLCE